MRAIYLYMLLALLIISILATSMIYVYRIADGGSHGKEVFFGVSFGLNTTREAKLLIDKVKDYTNLFVINSWDISTNETALNEICDYAAEANLKFIVFFSFVSRIIYPWHQTWLDMAKPRWGDKFLGVYLFDEPGGKQIDMGGWNEEMVKIFKNVSSYSEAAGLFVGTISSVNSTKDLKRRNITMFTSDYALYWFDYLAGYDCVFVEFGWNHSRIQHVALGRGAAKVQGKEWGVIITWTYRHPPYLENGTRLFEDLVTAYRAGAKYIIVFNYPKLNEYGILAEDHFNAMKKFWDLLQHSPEALGERVDGKVAYVLPKDYGWGMRSTDDKIWGIWPPDELSPIIWEKMNKLIEKYDLKLDIIYDDPRFDFKKKYATIYLWNSTIT
ncbi:MAG: hypothetical protein QW493_05625 [Candidatus Bathyarchaeia archaeon]